MRPSTRDVFIAPTDTTATTKTQAEVRDLIGKKGFVNEDDVHNFTYLKAVIKETFRLQAIAPLLVPRETFRKCSIGGYEVPTKTLVNVNAWAIGRDPEAWENPEEFYPERFIGSSIDFKGLNFRLIPFGAGIRVCPGMHMGVAAVELALTNLLYKFDWEMLPEMNKEGIDFDVVPGLTTHTKK
ncbi:cytochrome P450 83B1-like [Gossypium australe]|uniref:Cytochrome P450 83B1-like n=1 Tax=Gossypium australe TaxID=47621 RepID=A0A5B6WI73_9ROSI|nr:cytochrome P450 83B1-like [Gossypium australe]